MADIKHRIGIMGGTFDPIHMGHLILGEKAYEQFRLEKVLFMPSGNPPHKRNRQGRATDEERVEMVRRAIAGNPHFELSLTEMHENGYTYTYHTLEMLKEKNPDTDYYFIIGGDMVEYLPKWHRIDDLLHLVQFVGIRRPNYPTESTYPIIWVDVPQMAISSTLIRQKVKSGCSTRYLLPENVINYIQEKGLYQDELDNKL